MTAEQFSPSKSSTACSQAPLKSLFSFAWWSFALLHVLIHHCIVCLIDITTFLLLFSLFAKRLASWANRL